MLKNIILLVSVGFANVVLAQSSSYDYCLKSLDYYFLAGSDVADKICKQDSSANFIKCMEKKALAPGRAKLATEVAPECSKKRLDLPVRIEGSSTYVTFDSCESRMQIYGRLPQRRAVEICHQKPTQAVQKCYFDVVQGASWHPELAVQYCDFANSHYPKQLSKFSSCIILESKADRNEYRVVQKCHEMILYKPSSVRVQTEVEVKITPMKPVEPYVVEKPAPTATPEKQTGDGKVPTPVQIRVQEGAKPEVIQDQPLDAGSTSNSEVLPLN